MKKSTLVLFVALISFATYGQDKSQRPSPPAQVIGTTNGTTVSVDYSQPAVKGRTLWGELVPYGKVWRAGANETTSVTFSADVKVEGKSLKKGKYAFFVIPNEKEWIIIFNKTIKWGAFSYTEDEDVLRVPVPVNKVKNFYEKLTYEISENGEVSLIWGNTKVSFTLS